MCRYITLPNKINDGHKEPRKSKLPPLLKQIKKKIDLKPSLDVSRLLAIDTCLLVSIIFMMIV